MDCVFGALPHPSQKLLEEIRIAWGLYFPKRRLDETLGHYRFCGAVETVRQFYADGPD